MHNKIISNQMLKPRSYKNSLISPLWLNHFKQIKKFWRTKTAEISSEYRRFCPPKILSVQIFADNVLLRTVSSESKEKCKVYQAYGPSLLPPHFRRTRFSADNIFFSGQNFRNRARFSALLSAEKKISIRLILAFSNYWIEKIYILADRNFSETVGLFEVLKALTERSHLKMFYQVELAPFRAHLRK